MESIAYYDGQIGSEDELTVPFNDRSHFFGDGVYDAAMGANGKVVFLEDHLDRFFASAALFDISIPMSRNELAGMLTDLLGRVEGPSHFVYWQVTRGVASREHVYDPLAKGTIWAFVHPELMADPVKPLSLITMEDKRFGYCNAKTLNLMPAVLYAQAAHRAGAYETVLHRDGIVTECAHSNVAILKDGVLRSHPNDEHILGGIAKKHLIAACDELGIPVDEQPFTLEQLFDADEVIVTASSHLCTFASRIDGRSVGGKDQGTLRLMQDAVYHEYLEYCRLSELPCE